MSSATVSRRQCRRLARRAAVPLGAVFFGACSATIEYGEGAYANCADLGDLALAADSRTDAEQRMIAQVVELGGDTLVFDERGRSESGGPLPEEIVQRRDQLIVAALDSGQTSAAAVSPNAVSESPDEFEPETADRHDEPPLDVDRDRARRGRVTIEPVAAATGLLWYYGAALRCNRDLPGALPGPNPR